MLPNLFSAFIRSFLTFLLFFVFLYAYSKIGGPIPFTVNSVTTTKSTTFDVTGTGKAAAKVDQAQVMAGVSATGTTVKEVQEKINSTNTKVSSAVKALGIPETDIQTSNYDVTPSYDYTSGSQKITGYSANTNLTIKVTDITKLNSVIDAATSNGATNVHQQSLGTQDTTAAENEARQKAVADAKKKAETAAKTAGFQLGKLINYSENNAGVPGPRPFALDAKTSIGSAPTSIDTGSNEVTVTVTLSYEIR